MESITKLRLYILVLNVLLTKQVLKRLNTFEKMFAPFSMGFGERLLKKWGQIPGLMLPWCFLAVC